MKGHKAEVGVEERWVGIGEGELTKACCSIISSLKSIQLCSNIKLYGEFMMYAVRVIKHI